MTIPIWIWTVLNFWTQNETTDDVPEPGGLTRTRLEMESKQRLNTVGVAHIISMWVTRYLYYTGCIQSTSISSNV